MVCSANDNVSEVDGRLIWRAPRLVRVTVKGEVRFTADAAALRRTAVDARADGEAYS